MIRVEFLLFCWLLLSTVSRHRSLGLDHYGVSAHNGNLDRGEISDRPSQEQDSSQELHFSSEQDGHRGDDCKQGFGENCDQGRGDDGKHNCGKVCNRGSDDDGNGGTDEDFKRSRGDDGSKSSEEESRQDSNEKNNRCKRGNGYRGLNDDSDKVNQGRGDDRSRSRRGHGNQGRGDDDNLVRGYGDNLDRGQDSKGGSDEAGSDENCKQGSDEDCKQGSDEDYQQGSDEDCKQGSDEDCKQDSDEDCKQGSDEDCKQGSDEDCKQGSDEDCKQDSDEDCKQGSDEDCKQGSDEDCKQDSDEDCKQGSDEDCKQGSDEDCKQGSDEDCKQDSDEDCKQGSDEDCKQDSDEDCKQGSDEDCKQDSDEDYQQGSDQDGTPGPGFSDAKCCMEDVKNILKIGNRHESIDAIESLELTLNEVEVNNTTTITVNNLVALLHKPKHPFAGIEIYANDNKVTSDKDFYNSKVRVQLPSEVLAGSSNMIVFCKIDWPGTNRTSQGFSEILYEDRLVGLTVQGKNITGLQDRVIITTNLTTSIDKTQEPKCVFLNFSTKTFSEDGCLTVLDETKVTCSCDHLTYFGILLVTSGDVPTEHQEILSYITLIGCSLSLLALVITVLLFIAKRNVRSDVSMKVHIHLAVALILLNVHFLPSQAAAALSSSNLCLYIAISIHYFLLVTFSWMALEGFHLYLLLVKVFNIYIRKYLLKLSLVGWGVPVVIVSLVAAIDRDSYGIVSLDSNNPNSTQICYIANNTVKMVTTVGVFGLVFFFNLIMFGVTIRRIVCLRQSKQSGQMDRNTAKRNICTLLGVTVLLGIPWGLVFFSFGHLTIPGLYVFCILNTLQGFFIFLWFVMSLRKIGRSAAMTSSVTRSTNT